MSSFKTKGNIILEPNDSGLVHQFEVTVSSSATSNDGSIGVGRSVSSVTVSAHKDNGDVETGMLGSATESANIISLPLTYPTGGVGKYHIVFLLTLDNASVKEIQFNRVVAVDL